jgi:hypothetical protein
LRGAASWQLSGVQRSWHQRKQEAADGRVEMWRGFFRPNFTLMAL